MPIRYDLLTQALPGLTDQNILQTALTERGQNMNALQAVLQAQQQDRQRAQQSAMLSRELQDRELTRNQQSQQFDATLSQQKQIAESEQDRLSAGQQMQAQQAANQYDLGLRNIQTDREKLAAELSLKKDEKDRMQQFSQAYLDNNRTLMYAIDPEKAQKIEAGDRKTIMDTIKMQTDAQKVAQAGAEQNLQKTKVENTMRQGFLAATKDPREKANAFAAVQKLKPLLFDPNSKNRAVPQNALLYMVAKMYDPGRVTDGDIATVMGSGSVPNDIKNLFASASAGKLSNDTINSLIATVQSQYEAAQVELDNSSKQFGDIATRAGLNPENVVPNLVSPGVVSAEQQSKDRLKMLQQERAELLRKQQGR